MNGRWILSLMIAASVAVLAMFYVALRRAPDLRSHVTDQMLMEFQDYAQKIKHTDQIPVAQVGSESYSVPVQGPWKFEIRDKVLDVTAPPPENPNHQPLAAEQLPSAHKPVEDFVWSWLEDKYHSRKDMQVEVHFANEPPAH